MSDALGVGGAGAGIAHDTGSVALGLDLVPIANWF